MKYFYRFFLLCLQIPPKTVTIVVLFDRKTQKLPLTLVQRTTKPFYCIKGLPLLFAIVFATGVGFSNIATTSAGRLNIKPIGVSIQVIWYFSGFL